MKPVLTGEAVSMRCHSTNCDGEFMSFQVIEILESQPGKILVRVNHENNQFPVIVSSPKAEDIVIGKSLEAKLDYDEILGWKAIGDFEDASSGIWQDEDGIHLLGRIHSLLDYGDGKTIIDVYMQNGPEFFTASSENIDPAELESNGGLEITVGSLYLYPNEK